MPPVGVPAPHNAPAARPPADLHEVISDRDRARPAARAAAPRPVAIYGSFRYGQYFEDLLAGVVAAADAAGGSVISVQSSDGVLPSAYENHAQRAVSRAGWDHFDAAVVVLKAVSTDYVARLRAAGKFVVGIGQQSRGGHALAKIDNAGGIRDAVSHLAEHGHTRIGFVSPGWQVDTEERYAAYRERMTELGLTPRPLRGADLPPELTLDEQGQQAAREFLAGDQDVTAMFIATDLVALGFLRTVQEAGVDVPGQLAVIGIDDVAEAAVSSPPLATVAISFERVGEAAYTMAARGGAGEPVPETVLVPERLVPRESCGCASGSAGRTSGVADASADRFRQALVDVARESAGASTVDTTAAARVADGVLALFARPQARTDAVVEHLAAGIVGLCALDRCVQAALRAVRELADDPRDQGTERAGRLATALDLCDAVRSQQLQRRMTEYVELKRMQVSHYFIANTLLGHDRDQLRSLAWLRRTPAEAGALGLWTPAGQTDRLTVSGMFERRDELHRAAEPAAPLAVESFPPPAMLHGPTGAGRLVVVTQVRFDGSDWGLLAVAGGAILQSGMVQETFQQLSILMSASLDQERANADLARQAAALQTAYETEMALLEEVRISEERHALAAEAARDGLWDWDLTSGQVFYSSRWKAMLGHRDDEIATTPHEWLDRIHPDDAAAVREQLGRALDGRDQFIDVEHRLRAASGEYRWIACSGRSVLDDRGRPARLVGSITDVTVRRLLQEQLVQEAMYDNLTGLPKRSLFLERLGQAIERAHRRPDYRFAVLYLDLNGFKDVNDTLGHAAGDELLGGVAQRLTGSLRKHDTAARLGGDEFAVLLTDVDPDRELPFIVRRFESLISEPYEISSGTAVVGAAIGVCVSGTGAATPEAMLHEADTSMYQAKRAGRGRKGARSPVSG